MSELSTLIDKRYQDWLEKIIIPTEFVDEIIYHYTSASGLKGLLENHELWASNLANVNDAKELKLGVSIFQEEARKLRHQRDGSEGIPSLYKKELKSFAKDNELLKPMVKLSKMKSKKDKRAVYIPSTKDLAKTLESIINQVTEKVEGETSCSVILLDELLKRLDTKKTSNQYACCFTENGDQLSQWRAYGSYSVGFQSEDLLKDITLPIESCRIIYEKNTQNRIASEMIESYIDCFVALLSENCQSLTGEEIKDLVDQIMIYFEECLDRIIVSYKHEGFSEENERRIYLYTEEHNDIYIRERNGFFIPYIKLKMLNNKNLPIKEIYISPTADFDRASQGLRLLLDKNGYNDVEIKRSSIPYRL